MFNPMKRKMFFRLTAVCLMAVSVLIACTKDYGSDIKQLQDDMSKLSQRVQGVEDAIRNGAVITDVSPITGGTRVTLSNNKTFDIMNGVDGQDGEDGDDGKDGTVWKIDGPEGQETWWCDYGDGKGFVDSGMPARGPQGFKGDQGDPGKSAYELAAAKDPAVAAMTEEEWIASLQGKDGEDGLDGIYYVPVVEKTDPYYGHWRKVDPNTGVATDTELLWLPEGTLTAVWDDDAKILTIHNVEGAEDGIVEICLALGLNSLAFIPETWDATIGMQSMNVYALYPSWREFGSILTSKGGDYGLRNIVTSWNAATGASYKNSPVDFKRPVFWSVLWSSYLGRTNRPDDNYYDENYYMEGFDINHRRFLWRDDMANWGWDLTYEEIVDLFNNELLADLQTRIGKLSHKEGCTDYMTRQIPTSKLLLKYRVNPAGADLSDYQFAMLDRALTVETKADGDHRNAAVVVKDAKYNNKDQLTVTAAVDFWKYWADQPYEFLIKMAAAKAAYEANYYAYLNDNFGQIVEVLPDSKKENVWNSDYAWAVKGWESGYYMDGFNALNKYLDAIGVDYKTIVALEAAKNGNGAEAIVSDFANVNVKFVQPVWTAYNYQCPNRVKDQWVVPANAYNNYYVWNGVQYINDFLVVGTPYDVAAHMRFADPYYGTLENLGFTVKYDYYVFSAEHNAVASNHTTAEGCGTGNSPYGSAQTDWGGYDVVDVTSAGIVSVKADATDAIGKYVRITADASIYDEATGAWFTSGATNWAWPSGHNWSGCNNMWDDMAAYYIMQIVPNSNETINVEYDLGDIDYLTLTQIRTAPASVALEALGMDLEGFNNVYNNPVLNGNKPDGYDAEFARAADMFTVTLTNLVKLGNGSVTYTFTPKDSQYSTLCYTIKWNIVIDWTKTEPVLNEEYILYEKDEDGVSTGVLAKTDITPDPVNAYPTARPEGNFPYVDSIITVKGKEVDGIWKPQSSIKEHIHWYGSTLPTNVDNMNMEINFPNSQKTDGAEIILRDAGMGSSYKNQDIKLTKPFAMGEQSKDYVVDIRVTLANGESKVVKAYIVRFICPFYIDIEDTIELYTHTADWCSDRVLFTIRETGTGKLLVYWDTATPYGGPMRQWVTSYAQQTYGSAVFSSGSINQPRWHSLADPSFGERLLYNERTGWFYWCNMGTDLQVDKTTTYKVTQEISGLAFLTGEGNILIHKTADSPAAHSDEGHGPEIEPNTDDPNVHPTWEIAFE